MRDGTNAGVLTSVAADGAGWIGLAVLLHDAAENPRALECDDIAIARAESFPATQPLGLPDRVG